MASRHVLRVAHRLADRQTARYAEVPGGRDMIATVTTVTPGAATDGGAVVTVTYRGDELPVAAYLTAQVPVVDQRALLRLVDNQLILIGRLGGFPPEQ
jgi:hypothetical protein